MFLMTRCLLVLWFVGACSSSETSADSIIDGNTDHDTSSTDGSSCVGPPPSVDCTAPLAPGDDRTCSITVAGKTRQYLLYAPPSYNACAPAALVVDAHGSSEDMQEQAGLTPFRVWPAGLGSGMRLVADRDGFLVATPQGISNQWSTSDAAFMEAIPAAVAHQAALDPARTYMAGISNGAGLTYWTGCADAGVFHGFAATSGYDPSCNPAHPAPLIAFHTPTDKLVGYSDGQNAVARWVTANHCTSGPTTSWSFGSGSTDARPMCLGGGGPPWSLVPCDGAAPATTCKRWSNCDGGTSAMFCTVPPDNSYDAGTTGGHILYFNATKLSLAAVTWAFLTE